MIYIEPMGGLANRIRVISAALRLAREYDDHIICYWSQRWELKCRFDRLFKLIGDANNTIEIVEVINPYSIKMRLFRLFHKWYDFEKFGETESFLRKYNKSNSHGNYYIRACTNFYENKDCSWFELVDDISNKIAIKKEMLFNNKQYIGLHIRRTDNKWAIDSAPDFLFHEAIQREIANGNKLFYLASDDSKTKQTFMETYPNNIICGFEGNADRESEAGIIDAVVEIYMLAGASKIYGSWFSSFSELASWIGNTELEILHINE